MTDTVSDFLVRRLKAWGVHRIFGFPGDGVNGILGALQRSPGDPEFIQVRHEEMAAFMACGQAKFTGSVGVCLATSGPGAIHLLNGLYDAKMDHQGVVAIVGQAARTAMGASYQQEVDLENLFKDVAHEYVHTLTTPEQLPVLIDRAIRIAASERTVTCLIIPKDIQDQAAPDHLPHEHDTAPGSLAYAVPVVGPGDEDLQRAADVLNSGERVAILIGQGAREAADEVLEAADLLGAGIAKALLGKDVLPDDLPHVTGPIGFLGSRPSYDLMMDCDTLFMIGSNFPYSEFLPKPGQARGVQIDLDGRMIGIRYPMDVNLVGDCRETLKQLLPLLKRKGDRSWQHGIEENMRQWWGLIETRAMDSGDPINPERVFWELSSRLPEGAILTCDSGSAAHWFARDIKIRKGMRCSLSGNLATMGSAVPYAIGAKFAYPQRPVIALAGDGAIQMNGLTELLTIAKYWKHWSDPRLIVLVLHNNDLNLVTWEMRALEGNPKFSASQDIPDFDYAGFADSAGLTGIRVESPEAVGPAWDKAFAADRPVLIDAITDPNIPPLPPHITFKQARLLMSSMLKGDPDLGSVVRKTFRGVMREFTHPHKSGR